MDATQYLTPPYLKPEHVTQKNLKQGVISFAQERVGQFGKQIELRLETPDDTWLVTPNQMSIRALIEVWGANTDRWLSKTVNISVGKNKKGNDSVFLSPATVGPLSGAPAQSKVYPKEDDLR